MLLIILGLHPYNKEDKIKTSWYCELGPVYSNLTVDESSTIGIQTNDGDKYDSQCFYFEPGLQFSYPIKEVYVIGFNAGYFKEFKREDFELKGARGTTIKTNHDFYDGNGWDGFRLGLSFTYRLFKAK